MKIEKIHPWTGELDRGLEGTYGHDYAQIVEGVNRRWLEAYRLWDGAAYMVTRVENGVLTVCCYRGSRVLEAARWLRSRAAELKLSGFVFFTRRPGLARLLRAGGLPFAQEETVYRLEVA